MSTQRASYGLFILLLCGGCASVPSWQPTERAAVELVDVPFVTQTTDQCGPASLAALLSFSGVNVTVDGLRDRVYLPGRKGSLQMELLAATREAGRIAYPIESTPDSLLEHLDDGRPVLILQNLKVAWRSRWHYAVVVGFLPEQDAFVLRSGPVARLLVNTQRFLKTWQRGGQWGFVALTPGEIPTGALEQPYVRAVAAFESADGGDGVPESYAAAVDRWPDSVGARFGLANAHYAQTALRDALPLYESIVQQEPNHLPALNNLAIVYHDLGQRETALATIDRAISSADQSPLRATLLESRRDILSH